jgi:hypothetical protein
MKAPTLLPNIGLVWKGCQGQISSIFCLFVSDKEKSCIALTAIMVSNVIKLFSSSLMKKSSTLERFYKPFLSHPIFASKRQDYQEN